MFIVALFTIAKGGNRQYPSTDKWLNKMRYIHTMENYSCIKRNEILNHATMWMNLENISERNSTVKITFTRNIQNR